MVKKVAKIGLCALLFVAVAPLIGAFVAFAMYFIECPQRAMEFVHTNQSLSLLESGASIYIVGFVPAFVAGLATSLLSIWIKNRVALLGLSAAVGFVAAGGFAFMYAIFGPYPVGLKAVISSLPAGALGVVCVVPCALVALRAKVIPIEAYVRGLAS